MKKIRVLIAEDSAVYRSRIRSALSQADFIEIAGIAVNGRAVIERLSKDPVDLLLLDLEMPEMNGIQTLKEIRKLGFPCQIIVFASVTKSCAEKTLEALRLGAVDFAAKPGLDKPDDKSATGADEKIRALLLPKIQALYSHIKTIPAKTETPYPRLGWDGVQPGIVVIGSSTGGPAVLEEIFSGLRGSLRCPVVIAQHMPAVFTTSFAERLERVSGFKVIEAQHGSALEPQTVYLAPGNYHLRLQAAGADIICQLDQGPLINWMRPAVDPLFVSAASIYKDKCLAMVLTGMGADGKAGCEIVKQNGGAVVIQSKESSTVFGMPGAVQESGAYDRIADISELIQIIQEKALTQTFDAAKRVPGEF